VIEALTSLMYDDDRRRNALRALEPERAHLAEHWRAAADGDPATSARGFELIPAVELVA
jgi:glutamate--cysteine ligase